MIDSGGFGCIFRPQIRCENESERHDGVSKLQIKKYANKEFKMIKGIEKVLKHINNYKNYYLINIQKCKPKTLTVIDKKNMDCYPLRRQNITRKNVNKHLDELLLIQMEYGGPTLKSYIRKIDSYEGIVFLHKNLIDLLENGIIPMNKVGIIHSDLKLSNVLFDKHMKIIDWGFTYNMNEFSGIESKKIHFNLPFSIILFNKKNQVDHFFSKKKISEKNSFILSKILLNENLNDSHLEYVKELFENFTVNNINDLFILYNACIIDKFTNRNTKQFDLNKYFHSVYIHNCDIWSFIMFYIEAFDTIKSDLLKNALVVDFFERFYEKIILKYLLNIDYSYEKINTHDLLNDLNNI